MSKLKLIAAPTFKAKVAIPVPGGEPVDVEFNFRHRTRAALDEWLKVDRADVDGILDLVDGWDLSETFNRENVEALVQNYLGAPLAILMRYLEELTQAKRKN